MVPTLNYDISYIPSTAGDLYNKKDTDIEDGHEEVGNDSNVGSLPWLWFSGRPVESI